MTPLIICSRSSPAVTIVEGLPSASIEARHGNIIIRLRWNSGTGWDGVGRLEKCSKIGRGGARMNELKAYL